MANRQTKSDSDGSVPRWLKIGGLVVGLLLVLFLAMSMISGGEHGPGRHFKKNSDTSGSSSPIHDPSQYKH